MGYKYEGFWRAKAALGDKQALEEMIERSEMPWRFQEDRRVGAIS